jgi:hypothetical protein
MLNLRNKTQIKSNLLVQKKKTINMIHSSPIIKIKKIPIQIKNINKYNIKQITNVYQEKYLNHTNKGIGGFITGSVFLMQFCEKYNIKYKISLENHKISKFLKNSSYKNNNDNNISYYYSYKNNINDFKNYIQSVINLQNKNKNNISINNINIYTIEYPLSKNLSNKHKNYIKNIFEPSNDMNNHILYQLSIMNLKPYT